MKNEVNKYQEALKSYCYCCDDYSTAKDKCERREKCKSYKTLQELINKETPMKPIKEIIYDSYDDNDRSIDFQWKKIKCPNCKKDLISEPEYRDFIDYPYCPLCSQKLDWRDIDE